MSTEVVMPRLSDTMDSGTVARWLKHEGDAVKRGDIIAEIETDKANMELESYADGILARIIVAEGQKASLGEPIATIAANQQEADSLSTASPAKPVQQSAAPGKAATSATAGSGAAAHPETRETTATPRDGNERIKASPLARRMAHDRGVELTDIVGTGPGGRIVQDDVDAYLRAGAEPRQQSPQETPGSEASRQGEDVRRAERIEMSRMQQTIARRMATSSASTPQFILTSEFDMTEAQALVRCIRANQNEPRIGPNDLLIKAAATALNQHSEVNSGWAGNGIVRYRRINIGNAVAIPAGLVVPVIRDVASKSLGTISMEAKALSEKARTGKLAPSEYDGGTFTISNLGMYGIDQFTAIVNPPEACILAVGSITAKPVVAGGAVVVRERMRVSLSCDHRVINGAQGAEFLQTLRRFIENPVLALL